MFSDQKYMIGNAAMNQMIVSQPWTRRIQTGSLSMLAHRDLRTFMAVL
jgi:hypothetical protein